MITVTCPKCNAVMNCDDSAAGQVVKCYACQNDIVVPASKAAAPVFEAAAPAAPAAAQSSNILKFAGLGVGALIVAVLAAVIVFAISSCNKKSEYIEWMTGELAQKDNGSVYRNVAPELNGATIKNIELKSCEESSDTSGDYVTFKLNVGWQGKYNTSGSVEIDYVCKIVNDQLQYSSFKVVSSDNPSVEEFCQTIAATLDSEVLSDPNCDSRRRVEKTQGVSVYKAYTSKCSVETFGNTKDSGINGSNIKKISVVYHMKWNGMIFKDYYTDIAYIYSVNNGKWKYEDSGIIETNDPEAMITDIIWEVGPILILLAGA